MEAVIEGEGHCRGQHCRGHCNGDCNRVDRGDSVNLKAIVVTLPNMEAMEALMVSTVAALT